MRCGHGNDQKQNYVEEVMGKELDRTQQVIKSGGQEREENPWF